jgi:hypothetical protein
MIRPRTLFIALTLLGASSLGLAQTTPSAPPPPSSSAPSPSDQNTRMSPDGTSAGDRAAANDPKLKRCIANEKAKDSGLSDDQIKQKCMLHIASHQGQPQ